MPKTKPDKDGWEVHETPIVVKPENVKDLAPGQDSLEAAVVHFYASRLRGDRRYEEVLPTPQSESLKRKLAKMEKWRFFEVRILGRKKESENKSGFRMFLRLEEEEGTDSGEVERIDGKWYVMRPPT